MGDMNKEDIAENIQKYFEQQNIVGNAENTTSIQYESGKIELQQKNIVKYDNHIESVVINKRDILRIQKICNSAEDPEAPLIEISLGLSSLFAGAFFSALLSNVVFEMSWRSILFYVISPIIAVGAAVAFFLMRRQEQITTKTLAEHVMEYLPEIDDDKQEMRGETNES